MSRIALLLSLAWLSVFAACGGPEVRHPYKADDNTPANSTSESRLAGDDPSKPKSTVTSANADAGDPTQAQVNKVGDMPPANEGDSGKSGAAGKGSGKGGNDKGGGSNDTAAAGTKPSKTGPKVSKAECDRALDKALELEISSRPEFADLDKNELIKMAKQMGAQKHGEAPCDATRSQYNCAMAAKSTAEWKRCMQ